MHRRAKLTRIPAILGGLIPLVSLLASCQNSRNSSFDYLFHQPALFKPTDLNLKRGATAHAASTFNSRNLSVLMLDVVEEAVGVRARVVAGEYSPGEGSFEAFSYLNDFGSMDACLAMISAITFQAKGSTLIVVSNNGSNIETNASSRINEYLATFRRLALENKIDVVWLAANEHLRWKTRAVFL